MAKIININTGRCKKEYLEAIERFLFVKIKHVSQEDIRHILDEWTEKYGLREWIYEHLRVKNPPKVVHMQGRR